MDRPDVVSFAVLWRRAARRLEAEDSKLCDLDDDALRVIHGGLSDTLNPGIAAVFRSLCKGLWEPTKGLVKQLRDEHDAAAVLCLKMGMPSCRELREAQGPIPLMNNASFSAADLELLGGLGRSLPELRSFVLGSIAAGAAGPDGVPRLAAGLGAGALPELASFQLSNILMGNTGASALAAALGQGALLRLKSLYLGNTAIGAAGLVALAPALRRRPALESLYICGNPFGDEGLAALVAPPPAGAPPPPAGGLKKLRSLNLAYNQITDAGCATLAAALDSGALPVLDVLDLDGNPASAAAKEAVLAALARSKATTPYRKSRALPPDSGWTWPPGRRYRRDWWT